MAARRKSARSAPARRSSSGKLAVKVGLFSGIAGFVASLVVAFIVAGKLKGHVTGKDVEDLISQTNLVAFIMAFVAGLAVAGAAFAVASAVGSRLTDLSLAVSKMGRGTKAIVRVTGNDEISVLGRALSGLASDMAGQSDAEEGAAVDFDPNVRKLRDKALPSGGFESPNGFELGAAISPGSRGGLDYFDCHTSKDKTVMFLISPASSNAAATVAVRMARDEILRAVGTGAGARKALSHTNRILHKNLPSGVCATATLLEISEDSVKVYQAGSRVPVLLCTAGELEDLTAEGLALGLDSGPVFEKGLRSNTVSMTPGMRLLVLNDAGNRSGDFVASIQEHSPKHTTAFMNMVLGELEGDAGDGGLREDVVLMTVKRS